MQECSISSVLTLEIQQSCTKPSIPLYYIIMVPDCISLHSLPLLISCVHGCEWIHNWCKILLWPSTVPASNATSGDIVTTLASVAMVAVAHPMSRRLWLEIAGSTVCHLTLQRGLRQWTQSVLASSLDRRQGDPRQMAEIRKLRVNLQLLKSK